jgi:hypothetical protein
MSVFLSPVGGVASQFFDNSGNVLTGGKIYTYAAGTTTPLASYTTSAGSTAHANPIILDAAGRVPGGEVWLTGWLQYKFLLRTSTDVLIGTYDNIGPALTDAALVAYQPAGAGAVTTTVQAKLRESVSAKDFGAKGDGNTDDSTALQLWLDSSDTLVLTEGTYIVNATLNVTRSNVNINGLGSKCILKKKANTDGDILWIRGTAGTYLDNITVSGVTFDGNRLNQTGIGTTRTLLQTRYINDLTIRDNEFINAGYAGAWVGEVGVGVNVTDATNAVVDGNYIYRCIAGVQYGAAGPLPETTSHVQITNNYIDGDGYDATFASPPATTYPNSVGIFAQVGENAIISGNTIRGITTNFIGLYASVVYGPDAGQKMDISANSFYQIGGVAISADVNVTYPRQRFCTISGNIIDTCGQNGITNVGQSVITGNVILNCHRWAAAPGTDFAGILATSGSTLISNNYIHDEGVAKTPHGIMLAASAENGANDVITGNVITNMVTNGIYIAIISAGKFIDNLTVTNNNTTKSINIQKYDATPQGVRNSIISNNIASSFVGARSALDNIFFNNISTATNPPMGTFTCAASANTVVSNNAIVSATGSISTINFTPTNAAAATLMGSSKALFNSAKSDGISFTMTTADGAAAAGTETFSYMIN